MVEALESATICDYRRTLKRRGVMAMKIVIIICLVLAACVGEFSGLMATGLILMVAAL